MKSRLKLKQQQESPDHNTQADGEEPVAAHGSGAPPVNHKVGTVEHYESGLEKDLSDEYLHQISRTPLRRGKMLQQQNAAVLRRVSNDTLSLEPVLNTHYFAFAVALIALLLITLLLAADSMQLSSTMVLGKLKDIPAEVQISVVLCAIVFIAFIANQLRKPHTRIVFDKSRGVFWTEEVLIFGLKTKESAQMPLAHIIALQFLENRNIKTAKSNNMPLRAPNRTATGYELNVVLRNYDRVNLTGPDPERVLLPYSDKIANFLGIRVWHQAGY